MQNYLLQFQSAVNENQIAMTKGIGTVITTDYKRRKTMAEQNATLNADKANEEQGTTTRDIQIDETLDRLIGL